MSAFLQAFNTGRVLLMDGAMGTELQKVGANPGECFEHWNLSHPDRVRAVHQAYADAGAEVLLTNTFQANPTLLYHDMTTLPARSASDGSAAPVAGAPGWSEYHAEYAARICREAVTIAQSVRGVRFVVGDIGPMPDEPGGPAFPRPEPLSQLADWLTGVDAILLETCSDWSVWQAVAWLSGRKVPILLSLSFRTEVDGRIRSWDGYEPEDFARESAEHAIAALGVNCGIDQGISQVSATIRRMGHFTELPLFARPNAGTPIQNDGRWIYPQGPERMAKELPALLDAGICMVGGCCGTTPAHIEAIQRVLVSRTP